MFIHGGSAGRPSPQVSLHHLFSRRPVEKQSQEDLRGVSESHQTSGAPAAVSWILSCTSFLLRFRATLYPCPETPQERKEMLAGVNARIEDLQMVGKLHFFPSNLILSHYFHQKVLVCENSHFTGKEEGY